MVFVTFIEIFGCILNVRGRKAGLRDLLVKDIAFRADLLILMLNESEAVPQPATTDIGFFVEFPACAFLAAAFLDLDVLLCLGYVGKWPALSYQAAALIIERYEWRAA